VSGIFSAVGGTAYVAKTGSYTLTPADYTVEWTSGTATATLPTAVGVAGQVYVLKNNGAGIITIATTSSQTIDAIASGVLTLATRDILAVQSNGANWIIVNVPYSTPHGSFLDTTTQAIATPGTPQVITLNTDTAKNKITHSTSVDTGRITVTEAGLYIIIASMQTESGAAAKTLDVWLRKNGNDVVNTNSQIKLVSANDEKRFVITFTISLAVNDYIELWMNGDSASLQLQAVAAQVTPTRPATPSITLTIDRLA